MSFNYFTGAYLPELAWNMPTPGTFGEFMEANSVLFEELEDKILLLKEITSSENPEIETDDTFINWYASASASFKIATAAHRIIKLGLDLEENLTGDEETVRTIIENKNSPDLGLKTVLPEAAQIPALLDKEPLEMDLAFDRLWFEVMDEYIHATPFEESRILAWIAAFLILDRKNTRSKKDGRTVLEKLAGG